MKRLRLEGRRPFAAEALLLTTVLVGGAHPARAGALDLTTVAAGTHGFVINGAGENERSGQGVSGAGDVNGDGIGDIVVGAPYATVPPTKSLAGRVYVIFGKSGGAPVSAFALTSSSSGIGFRIEGSVLYGKAGAAVSAAGDTNGDGLGDLLIGAQNVDGAPQSQSGRGRAYLVFGKTSSTPVFLSALESGASPLGYALRSSAGNFNAAGRSVGCIGDMNNDGLSDFVIGARPDIDFFTGRGTGLGYVIFGRTATSPIELSTLDAGDNPYGFCMAGFQDSNQQCEVAGAGDVNGDGVPDVIVGVPSWRSAFVVFGRTARTRVELSAMTSGASAEGFSIHLEGGVNFLGDGATGVGDMNGDGLADIGVGSSSFTQPGVGRIGAAFVVFGKTTTTPVQLSTFVSGPSPLGFMVFGHQANDVTGQGLGAAGDANGDGLADLLVGADGADPSGLTYAGRGYLILGRTNPSNVQLSELASGNSPLGTVLNAEASFDRACNVIVGGGDINGDGLSDFVTSARFADPVGNYSGRSYVVFPPVSPSVVGTWSAWLGAGDPVNRGIGTAAMGGDLTAFADSRAWIDATSANAPSLVSVRLTRSDSGLSGLPSGITLARVLDARWTISSTRVSPGAPRLTLRYTNAELAGLPESDLAIYRATRTTGPWTLLPGIERRPSRNEISALMPTLEGSAHYIVASMPVPPSPTPGLFNDMFANAAPLMPTNTVVITSATRETGELYLFSTGEQRTVWYRWTPNSTVDATLTTCGSHFDTVLGAYRGDSLASLFLVAKNDNNTTACPGLASALSFRAFASVTYHITLATAKPTEYGTATLTLSTAAPSRRSVGGEPVGNIADLTQLNNYLAGLESAPPPYADYDADGDVDGDDAKALIDHLANQAPLP